MKKSAKSQKPTKRFETTLSFAAVIISFLSVLFTVSYHWWPGNTVLLSPSGYAIIRGIRHIPSDHLVLPMEWKNTSGQSVLIRHPTLILRQVDSKGRESDTAIEFSLAGEYETISDFEFEQNYEIKRSFILDSHSISLRTFVFHIENWWDEDSDDYDFRFSPDTNFQLSIRFQRNDEPAKVQSIGNLPIYDDAGIMGLRDQSSHWWDFWTVEKWNVKP